MFQIREDKQKQLASSAVAVPFVCACFPAGTIRIHVVRTVMAPRKEAAP